MIILGTLVMIAIAVPMYGYFTMCTGNMHGLC